MSQNIKINGVFHIGAHECEELDVYNQFGLQGKDIVWIDAINGKVLEAKNRGIENVYNAVVTDKDDDHVMFNIANNFMSSSVLEFGTHAEKHPDVFYVDKIQMKTITIDSFFERNNLDASKYNFWNFDIQGAELMALKGATKSIEHADAMYLEINIEEVYKGCGTVNDIDDYLRKYNFKRVYTSVISNGWGEALYIKNKQSTVH